MANAFAIYRMPHRQECRLLIQRCEKTAAAEDYRALTGVSGFVVAPFAIDSRHPISVIEPDTIIDMESANELSGIHKDALDLICRRNYTDGYIDSTTRADYGQQFAEFHAAVSDGEFDKLVLARRAALPIADVSPSMLFIDACSRYPRSFVALFSAPECGTWIVATPELLLEADGNCCRTMALAGTMPYAETLTSAWSRKNAEEQHLVDTYIKRVLSEVGYNISATEPHTVRAGELAHLRSDFTFEPNEPGDIGAVVERLHPTPAVCGLPKDKAREFILTHEHTGRGYYSGFCGPVNIKNHTDLYVSLRCMRLSLGQALLYAGGGILPGSDEASEWQETEHKMQTMRRLLI